MRRTKACFALVLAAGAALTLCGCGPMTPEKLAGKVKQATEKTPTVRPSWI